MCHTALRKTGRYLPGLFLICCLLSALPAESMATDLTAEQFQKTLSQSLKALWTGQEFGPELVKKQTVLKEMLKTGAVTGEALKDMMKQEMVPLITDYVTSRYILKKELPERINALFAPFIDGETFKEEIVWGVITPRFNKEPYILKLATLAPDGTPWLDIPMTMLVPKIIRLTDGKLTPKFYTGGVMGEDTDVLRKMDIGQLDGCGCTTLGVFTAAPESSVFMVPNLFNNYEEIDYVYEKLRKKLDRFFEQKGYICGAIIDSGFLYVFSKNKIVSLDGLKKHKTITCMGDVEAALLKELGVNAVPVAMPEVVSSLSTGMADTFIAPAAWALGMQAYQYVNYYIKTPFFYSPGVVLVSTNARSKIQKHFGVSDAAAFNTQELIVLELISVEPEWKKRGRIYEEKSLKAFETKCGIKPLILSPEDQKAFEAAAARVQEKLAGKLYPQDLLDDVLKTLEEYRKK